MQDRKNYTYVKKASGQEMARVIKAAVYPVAIFFFCIISISIFKNFGRLLMAPLISAMWAFGALCAFLMPAMRKEIINQTLITLASYCAALLAFRELIGLTAGVSSQMLMATFGQPMSTAMGNTLPGYMQNMLYITAVMVPLGYLGMQGKRFLQFKKTQSRQKVMAQLRGHRNAK